MKHLIHTIMLMLTLTAAAQDFEVDGIYYNIKGDSAIVTTGAIQYSGDVVIPEEVTHSGTTYPVTAIGHSAFSNCISLSSITIPRTITTVGEHAFAGCTGLDSVEISDLGSWCSIEFESAPANPCHYAHRLFLNGEEIIDLSIPDSVSSIGSFAFSGCTSLNSVNIPSGVTDIGPAAFAGCSSISSITVASDNPTYDSRDSCNAIIRTASGK